MMKEILRKIETSECKNFSLTLRGHVDYTKVLLEITKKILSNSDTILPEELSGQAYLKLSIDKQSRVFIYLSKNKFYSFEYPYKVDFDIYTKKVQTVYTNTGINCTWALISNAFSILADVKCNSIIDVYESRDEEDSDIDINAYKMLEAFWANEPSYLRYDYDEKNRNGDLHPLNHLDINMSDAGSYKLGIKRRLTPAEFEDIINKRSNCYYLVESLPLKMLSITNSRRKKNVAKNKRKRKKQGF